MTTTTPSRSRGALVARPTPPWMRSSRNYGLRCGSPRCSGRTSLAAPAAARSFSSRRRGARPRASCAAVLSMTPGTSPRRRRRCDASWRRGAALGQRAVAVAEADLAADVSWRFVRPRRRAQRHKKDLRRRRIVDATPLGRLVESPAGAGRRSVEIGPRGRRHPTLTGMVTNDSARRRRVLGAHGPNAGGSSVARAVALASIYACRRAGPREASRASLWDAVFTRMGAADALAAGRSTFLHELRGPRWRSSTRRTSRSSCSTSWDGHGDAPLRRRRGRGARRARRRGCATIFAPPPRPRRERQGRAPGKVATYHGAAPPWAAGRSTSIGPSCSTLVGASRTSPGLHAGGGAARRGPAARPGEAHALVVLTRARWGNLLPGAPSSSQGLHRRFGYLFTSPERTSHSLSATFSQNRPVGPFGRPEPSKNACR